MPVSIHAVGTADLAALCDMARVTYFETFKHRNTPENMQAYLARAFSPEKLLAEINNPESAFFFMYKAGALAGYMKVNTGEAQSGYHADDAMEVQRLYFYKEYQGQGLGVIFLNHALHLAQEQKKKSIWLGVWSRNERAIALYTKMGFAPAATYPFQMGGEVQTDVAMSMEISEDTIQLEPMATLVQPVEQAS